MHTAAAPTTDPTTEPTCAASPAVPTGATAHHGRRLVLGRLAAAAAAAAGALSLALSLALTVALSGCASLLPGPRSIQVSEARLVQAISSQFPFNSRYLELFDVALESPRVKLLPAENRIATELRYSMGAALLGERKLQGALGLSYGLRFEPGDGTVRLTGVKLENFDTSAAPRAQASLVNRMGGVLAESLLQDHVVYQVKADDLQALQRQGYRPGALKVVPGGLELQMDPLPR